MRVKKNLIILTFLLGITLLSSLNFCNDTNFLDAKSNSNQSNTFEENYMDQDGSPESATGTNYNNIQKIFNDKLSKYNSLGYFPQFYDSSLQATYYALYILDVLGKLDTINQTAITEYILSYYNSSSHVFTDKYAYRYLDTDVNKVYYPFSTLLEVNCYAILSLDILNQLSLIPIQDSIDFILSCYHPTSHAFIGQPYDSCPSGMLKIPTMDNTFYAIIALDTLGADLGIKKNEITIYINNLQIQDYGFANDGDKYFRSLGRMLEPNLLSAYYSIKSLEMFGYEDSIDTVNFHQYLQTLYDAQNYIFQMGSAHTPDKDNIVASALGLQLSDLTPFNSVNFLDSANRDGVINFILDNRNSMGNWDSSTTYEYHELIDTFQIIRVLKETGVVSQLSTVEENEIANAISNYFYNDGYALLSSDYVSVEHYYNVINAFYHYDRIADIDLHAVYEILRDSCLYENPLDLYYFYACTNMPLQEFGAGRPEIPGGGFRSYPIEYFTTGNREFLKEWNRENSHKAKFMALDTLKKIFKLDDFERDYNLNAMLNDVVNSQFLEGGYSNYGAFLPTITLSLMPLSYQNSEIVFEDSYYAIKTLDLLVNYLGLSEVEDLSFNKGALYNYIVNNINETTSTLYMDPQYTDNLEIILKNTYYMIEILQILNLYDLNNQKIKNFLLASLNYENIKNIYYCFKISETLNLGIEFDINLTSSLVASLYSDGLKEYYESKDSEVIEQEVFMWVCDMAINDEFQIDCNYEQALYLGGVNTISTSFSNMILTKYDQEFTVRFESDQFGILTLEKQQDSTYQVSFLVPEDPNYYPSVNGVLKIYQNSILLEEYPIIFYTFYDFNKDQQYFKDDERIVMEYNISYKFSSGDSAALNTSIFADIYKEGSYYITENFTRVDFIDYSKFSLDYEYPADVNCSINVIMVDLFNPEGLKLYNSTIKSIEPNPPPEPIPPPKPDPDPDPDPEPDPTPFPDEPQTDWLTSVIIGILIAIAFTIIAIVTISKLNKMSKSRERNKDQNKNNGLNKHDIRYFEDDDDYRHPFSNTQASYAKSGNNSNLDTQDRTSESNSGVTKNYDGLSIKEKVLKFFSFSSLKESFFGVVKQKKKDVVYLIAAIITFAVLYFYGSILIEILFWGGIVLIAVGVFRFSKRYLTLGVICLILFGLILVMDDLTYILKLIFFFL